VKIEGLELTSHVIAKRVSGRQPVDAGTSFPADVGRVLCHLVVKNRSKADHVEVVWMFEGVERSRTRLKVGQTDAWHTWAESRIPPERLGAWRCDVLGPGGELLGSAPFEVK
jgi:hypothetical protein